MLAVSMKAWNFNFYALQLFQLYHEMSKLINYGVLVKI